MSGENHKLLTHKISTSNSRALIPNDKNVKKYLHDTQWVIIVLAIQTAMFLAKSSKGYLIQFNKSA